MTVEGAGCLEGTQKGKRGGFGPRNSAELTAGGED